LLWLWAFSIMETIGLAAFVLFRLARSAGNPVGLPTDVSGSSVAPDYVASVVARLHEWPIHTLTVIPAIFIVGLGMWAAKRRLLEDLTHRGLLWQVAIAGLAIAVAGGLPLALVHAGIVRADARTLAVISLLHGVSGTFGGPGYVALLGLVAQRQSRGTTAVTRRITQALVALGQRSLSGYLFQSLAWQLLLPPYTLALGSRFGSPLLTSLAAAFVVWLLSIAGAAWLQRGGRSGPAEFLLRRLAYGRSFRGTGSVRSSAERAAAVTRIG